MPGPDVPAGRATPPSARRSRTCCARTATSAHDDWYWLRDRDDPEVIAYLEAENAYADAMLAPLVPLRDRIFDEIKSRVQETDESAPVADGAWEYTSRTQEGSQYAIHCRRPRGKGPEAARRRPRRERPGRGHDYFALGGFEVTPDHAVLAYSVDFNGSERYTLALPRPRRPASTSPTSSRT